MTQALTQAQPRNTTLDIAKGVGIIFVVFGHNWAVLHEKGEMFRLIFSFHMPLFFFLSGVFIRGQDSIPFFAKTRAKTLLKPYFVTLLTLGVFRLLTTMPLSNGVKINASDYFYGIIYATGNTIEWIPLWFLPHLFISSLLVLLITKLDPLPKHQLIIALGLLLLGVAGLHPGDWPWSMDLLPISVAFILLGYSSRHYAKSMVFCAPYFLAALLLFSALHFLSNNTIDLNTRLYDDFLITTTQALLGIYLSLSFSSLIGKNKALNKSLSYVGSGTLYILIFHSYFQGKIYSLCQPLGDTPWIACGASLVGGLVFPLLIWEFSQRARRWVPAPAAST